MSVWTQKNTFHQASCSSHSSNATSLFLEAFRMEHISAPENTILLIDLTFGRETQRQNVTFTSHAPKYHHFSGSFIGCLLYTKCSVTKLSESTTSPYCWGLQFCPGTTGTLWTICTRYRAITSAVMLQQPQATQ